MSSRWTNNRKIAKKVLRLREEQHKKNIDSNLDDSSDETQGDSSSTSLFSLNSEPASNCSFTGRYNESTDNNETQDSINGISVQDHINHLIPIRAIDSLTSSENHSDSSTTYSTTTDSEEIVYNSEDSSCEEMINAGNNSEDCIPENTELSITQKLARIKIDTNCSLTTVAAFAKLLIELGHEVPKDARTIMKTKVTPSQEVSVGDQANTNSFVHLGLKNGLMKRICTADRIKELILQFNIDGLPLWRSSRTEFWPIICRIVNAKDTSEFLVSLHCGVGKPSSLKCYITPFLNEKKYLLANGLEHQGRHFTIKIGSFCCDAPARAFIKQIIGHGGYSGCERCEVHGSRSDNRTIFKDLIAPLRANESFRSGSDDHHHNSLSPLEEIESLDMVYDFPLDYLHLVCLGVMKRLLKQIWMEQHPNCFSRQQRQRVNYAIHECSMQLPKEFNRKGRPLDDISHWKANEFRTFLLYTGIYVLKDILPQEQYDHFINFHVAIRILTSPRSTPEQINFAGEVLVRFVSNFSVLYGDLHIVYNVHSLIHLAKEVHVHGPLDSFSCFSFESYLGKLKRLLRNSRLPLKQIVRRLSEIDAFQSALIGVRQSDKVSRYSIDTFKSIIPNSKNDCYVIVKRRSPLVIKVVEMDRKTLTGYVMKIEKMRNDAYNEYFSHPTKASDLNIFLVGGCIRKKRWNKYDLGTCVKAVFIRKTMDRGLIIPLLH